MMMSVVFESVSKFMNGETRKTGLILAGQLEKAKLRLVADISSIYTGARMGHFSQPRLVRPRRRPATRSQVRQRARQFRDRYALEAALDQLHLAFLNEELCSIEEQI